MFFTNAIFLQPLCVYVCKQMFFDELTALRCVLSHVEFKKRRHVLKRLHFYRSKVYGFWRNELTKFVRADFTKSLESCHLCTRTKLLNCLIAFVFTVAGIRPPA